MDEEELEQSGKKITISNFFDSIIRIDRVADRAFKTSSTNIILTKQNSSLIKALESSFRELQNEVQQITNYIIIDQKDRGIKLDEKQRNIDKMEDDKQKGIDDAQKGLEDDQPFSSGNKLLEGLSGAANQFLANNADLLVGGAIGMLPFSRGRLVPGSGNSDTVKSLLTPGEFVIPKNVVETYSPTFFEGLVSAADTNKSNEKNKKKVENPYGVDPKSKDFAILTAISSLEGGDSQSRVDVAQSIYNRFYDVQSDISDGKMDNAAFDYTKSSFKADKSGKFPKLTLSDILLKEGQYQPAFKDPTKTDGTIAPEFSNITDKDSAILAMKSYFDKRGDKRSMKEIENLFDQTSKDLQDEKLIKSAQKHVGGNTEFLSGDSYQEGDAYRGQLGVDNTFFTKYGSGDQIEAGAASSPLIKSNDGSTSGSSSLIKSNDGSTSGSTSGSSPLIESNDGSTSGSTPSLSPNLTPKIENKELSQNLSQPPIEDNLDTEILPAINNAIAGGAGGESTPTPTFTSPKIDSTSVTSTESVIPFIDVISNQYLSIV